MKRSPEEWTSRVLCARYQGTQWDRGSWSVLLHSDEPRHIEGALLGMREKLELRIADPCSPDFAHFWWSAEQRDKVGRVDPNTLCFYAFQYLLALNRHPDRIPADLQRQWREAVETGFAQAIKRDIHAGYTNIACLLPAYLVLGAEQFGHPDVLAYARRKIETWLAYHRLADAPREYMSPPYTPVALQSLAEIVERASDPETRSLALEGEQSIWRHVGRRYHLLTRQVAGPHSRVYSQDASFPLLVAVAGIEEIAGDPAAGLGHYAVTRYHPPDDLADLFMRRAYPQFLTERVEPYLPPARMEIGVAVELGPGREGLLRMTHYAETDLVKFRSCRTFFAEEFTLGSMSETQSGAQRNNFVMHLLGRGGRPLQVCERVTYDGRQFIHNLGYCSAFADQKGPSALLVRKLHKTGPTTLLPYAPAVDASTPVEQAALEVHLPPAEEMDETWDGDQSLAAGVAGPLVSSSFAFRVGDVWAGFRLADAAARWELIVGGTGMVLHHTFWRRGGPVTATAAALAEAGSASLRNGTFAQFRQRLAVGSFHAQADRVEFARPDLSLVVALDS